MTAKERKSYGRINPPFLHQKKNVEGI